VVRSPPAAIVVAARSEAAALNAIALGDIANRAASDLPPLSGHPGAVQSASRFRLSTSAAPLALPVHSRKGGIGFTLLGCLLLGPDCRGREQTTPMSSGPKDFHLRALPKPYVNLSIHTAPVVRPFP